MATAQPDMAALEGSESGPPRWVYGLVALGLLYCFLVSISLMGASFKLFGAGFAETLIKGCTRPVVGLFIGILATGLVQSSSTTTSLVVGFVGGGVLPIEMAVPLIMGANIGTTITNLIVAMGFVTRKEDFRRAFAGATVHDFFNLGAVLVLFPLELKFHMILNTAKRLTLLFDSAGGAKFSSPLKLIIKPTVNAIKHFFNDTLNFSDQTTGIVLFAIAIAVLIFSLVFLVKTLRVLIVARTERFVNNYLFRNDFTAFLLGIAITVLVQSSSITTSVIVPLVGAGVVTIHRCYPFTLGANIGTTCTALLASLATVTVTQGGSVGVTAAFAHLAFNVFGIAIFYPLKRIPIFCARRMADLAVKSKTAAIAFFAAVFFGLPLLIILLTK